MARDGRYAAYLDRFEEAEDERLAVLLLERDGEVVDELAVPAADLPPGAGQDAVLAVTVSDGALAEARLDDEETADRRAAAQARFDRLARRPADDAGGGREGDEPDAGNGEEPGSGTGEQDRGGGGSDSGDDEPDREADGSGRAPDGGAGRTGDAGSAPGAGVRAYLLVDAAAGTADDVLAGARAVDGVTEAHVVAGQWDLVVELEGEDVRDVLRTVTAGVRSLDGVGTTRCYVCLD